MFVVTFTYGESPDEDTAVSWTEMLDELNASVALVPGIGSTITVWVESPDAVQAINDATAVARRVTSADPIGIDSVDEAEHQRRADAPTLPELVSAPEVGDILGGISRQRVHQLRALESFPAPVLELRTGPIWTVAAIEKFNREWQRRPGRPKVTA